MIFKDLYLQFPVYGMLAPPPIFCPSGKRLLSFQGSVPKLCPLWVPLLPPNHLCDLDEANLSVL